MTASVTGDLVVSGDLRLAGNITPKKARADLLLQAATQPFHIPWTWWRVHDAVQTNLPGTAATDDLELTTGTLGTAPMTIQTGDLGAAGATTRYARAMIPLPWTYQSAQTVTLRFHAGMLTAISDGTATLDVEAYESDKDNTVSADLYAGAAKDINSMTFADIDFAITPTNLVAGDVLDVRIAIAVNDAGTAVTNGCIGDARILCDCQ